jgi:hypothetical protein
MYSSYTSILLVVVTHCCLYSRYQQAEIGRAGTSRHQLLTAWPGLASCSSHPTSCKHPSRQSYDSKGHDVQQDVGTCSISLFHRLVGISENSAEIDIFKVLMSCQACQGSH